MPPLRRPTHPPLRDPAHVGDVFANGFDVQDWEDWLRLVCTVDDVADDGGNGARAQRRKAASIVIPRSSLDGLVKALRVSTGTPRTPQRRHS